MKCISIFATIFALLVSAVCNVVRGQDFKTDGWLADFAQLKQEISVHYANLEWAVEARGLDLKQLSERTESRLHQASNAGEAQAAVESFLNAFGDGHLEVQWRRNSANTSSSTVDSPAVNQPPLCQRLRFQSQEIAGRIDFSRLSGFREIKNEDSKYFAIGVLRFPNNKEIGVIRIALFSQSLFPDLCEQAATGLGLTKDSPCDEECEDRVERKSGDLLTAALGRQIEVLRRNKKMSALLVDITGNGGGTNWAEPAARSFTPKPLRSPRQQFIRHEHWTKQFHRRLEIIEADLRQPSVSNRVILNQASGVLRQAIMESQKSCRREAIWENQKLNCSLVAAEPSLYPQSVLPYATPGSLPDTPSNRYLFYPSRYKYREGVYAGRLMILADRGTWSSAEYFAAMLRDNNAATIIGEPTGGAGCGYTNGGIPIFLKNTGAKVKIPDCVRLRADGSNEVAGITPDMLVPWRANDTRFQRANRVFDVLAKNLSSRPNRLSK
jgi:hypothetical protein